MVLVFKEFILRRQQRKKPSKSTQRVLEANVSALCKVNLAALGFGKIPSVSPDRYCQKQPSPLRTGSCVSFLSCSFYSVLFALYKLLLGLSTKYSSSSEYSALYLLDCGLGFLFFDGYQKARGRFMAHLRADIFLGTISGVFSIPLLLFFKFINFLWLMYS